MGVNFLPCVFAVCARFAYSELVLNKLCFNSCVKTIILDRESSNTFQLKLKSNYWIEVMFGFFRFLILLKSVRH